MPAKIVVIDDEDLFREDFASLLRREGHECKTATNGKEGLTVAKDFNPGVIFCDVVMPGRSGVELLDELMQICPESCVFMITAYGTLETAVEAFRKGAYDYIIKPLVIEDVLQKIERCMEHQLLASEVKYLRREISQDVQSLPMIGQSEAMQKVFDLISKVAPTKSKVLLTGESGTGKELVARALHEMSCTGEHPFVGINCAGISEHLLESEIFGHVRGAFTGAISDRTGFFELAGEGTLFLDEISEMSLSIQSKLLRVLDLREFTRVGSTMAIPLKAHIIVSTNRDLKELVKAGKFREDLYFRIAVLEIHLPPLRERRSDIPLLTEYFVKKFNKELKRKCLGVNNEVIRSFMTQPWSGNVRELKNVIERAMILNQEEYISLENLPPEMTEFGEFPQYSDNLRDALHAFEREHIRRVLSDSGGNKEKTARRLGINPSTLYRKMTELDFDHHSDKKPSS